MRAGSVQGWGLPGMSKRLMRWGQHGTCQIFLTALGLRAGHLAVLQRVEVSTGRTAYYHGQ